MLLKGFTLEYKIQKISYSVQRLKTQVYSLKGDYPFNSLYCEIAVCSSKLR